jgi:hypothetical protein
MLHTDQKSKTCAYEPCGRPFFPQRMGQIVCGPACAGRHVKAEKVRARTQLRTRKEALQTIPELIKLTQRDFNAYIRERDKDQPCICCGQQLGAVSGHATGGAFDCGHYRSTGSASHLRFDERNAHGQRKVCNRYGGGKAVNYRIGLVARIGLQAVEFLESSNKPHKWTADELRSIRATYKAKLKELK